MADHADRLGPLLGEPRGIKDNDCIGFADVIADLLGQQGEAWLVAPRNLPDEVLETLSLAIMKVGDRLARLPGEFGEQAGEILGGMTPLHRLFEQRSERLDEGCETTDQAVHQLGRDLDLGHHLSKLKLISLFHDCPQARVAQS